MSSLADEGSGTTVATDPVDAPEPGSERLADPAFTSAAPSAVAAPAGHGSEPGTDADLVRDLRRRVAALEAETDGAAAKRQVSFTARSVVEVLAMILFTAAIVGAVFLASGALTLVLVALIATLALHPAVDFFVRHGFRRGWAAALVFVLGLLALALLGLLLIPPLVTQVSHFIDNLPTLVADLSKGRGPFGFLERKFHVVEEVKKLVSGNTAATAAGSGLGIALGVGSTLVSGVVIAFLTFFMLLEGHNWVARFMSLVPDDLQPRYRRVGTGISNAVSGFVTGNLAASLLGGAVTTVILLVAGLPYPVPLGVMVGILDLLPIFGAFVALAIIAAVAFAHGVVTGIVVTGLVFLYHQLEVYYLRPIITGRMVELSPLAVLVAAVVGVELAGPLGAIAAIPIGGTIQVIVVEVLDARACARRDRRSRVGQEDGIAEASS